jgi:multiple sugar transport system permease protein
MGKRFYWSLEEGDLLPVILMAPAVLLVLCVLVAPLCFGVFLSFFDFGFGGFEPARDFVGLKHYVAFFHDQTALRAVLNTLAFSAGAILGDFVIGTGVAVLLFQLSRRFASFLRPLVTIPLLISPLVVGLIWRYMYDPRGLLYWLLGLAGVTIDMFPGVTAASTALVSTVIAHWWQVTPFVVIVVTAGLVSIPVELYEAAYADGASAAMSFRRITLPLLRDVYMVILLVSGVDTIKVFDIVFALTGGGPNDSTVTTSIYAYSQGFSNSNLSYAMAISVIAMLVTFLVFGLPFTRHNRSRAAR